MSKSSFPHPNTASEEGIVAIGGELSLEYLEDAYSHGIFPWPIDRDSPLTWFSPNPRGVIDLKDFNLNRSNIKLKNSKKFYIKFNTDFEHIIYECAKMKRYDQTDTWIHDDVIKGYINLFSKGKAYCVGTYLQESNELVGGLYGVCFGQIISGESMFHIESNASKYSLIGLIEKLRANNINWIDTQMVTPIIEQFGGKYISREQFLDRLKYLSKNLLREDIFR